MSYSGHSKSTLVKETKEREDGTSNQVLTDELQQSGYQVRKDSRSKGG